MHKVIQFIFQSKLLHILIVMLVASLSSQISADTPLGWISNNNPAAYTIDQGELELAASLQAINGTIDFLDVREDFFCQ